MEKKYTTLGDAAIGSIEPGEHQQEQLNELTDKLADGAYFVTIAENLALPVRCVDGRIPEDGANPLGPNSAGGSESLFVANDLTKNIDETHESATAEEYEKLLLSLSEQGYEVGGHTSDHAHGEASGCGANDKLTDIYHYIAENGATLQRVSRELGIAVDDQTNELLMHNARQREVFSSGRELLDILHEHGNNDYIDMLAGDHNEVVAVINSQPHTTLDRDAVRADFGDDYQVFNVDAWSFQTAAEVLTPSNDETEINQKVAALAYYNLATTYVLAGPTLRLVVR